MAAEVQERALQLKVELKTWERAFAADHQGCKPTKADIKGNPVIAAKYKQYDELCRPQSRTQLTPQKRKRVFKADSVDLPTEVFATPRAAKRTQHDSPLKPMSPTPQAIRQRLGPTPQRDGQILGLFEDLYAATPSASRRILSELDTNITATPSRSENKSLDMEEDAEGRRLGRTPTSSGKRYMLDTFATPMKRKREDVAHTPTTARGIASTPRFLQRTSNLFRSGLETLNETGEVDSLHEIQPPFKKRGFVRSLSSIIKGLKKQEVDKADEDWDLLQELEAGPDEQRPQTTNSTGRVPETQFEEDSNDGDEMPLGPDALPVSDQEDNANDPGSLDANGQPRKVWKKKGLKRQTRKVKMRPALRDTGTTNKDPTSLQDVLRAQRDLIDNESSSSDFEDHDATDTEGAQRDGKSKTNLKTISRKIKATAHANFCRLKIKNKNSKAKGRGRFGRR